MRPTTLMKRLSLTTALGVGLAVVALAVPTDARAGDDDVPIDTQILRNVMTGLGLKDPNAPEIDYQERSPLVIPPNSALPPPQKAGAAIANDPNWPKDPDVARAKALRQRAKNRDVEAEMLHDMQPLSASELNPKTRTRTAGRSTGGQEEDPRATGYGFSLMSPDQLNYKGGLFTNMFGSKDDDQAVRFTGEPARTSLTEPPPGYQTPSPDQPYGVGAKNEPPKADNNYITHGEYR